VPIGILLLENYSYYSLRYKK